MKKLILTLFLVTAFNAFATDISVNEIAWNKNKNEVKFTLSWKNGWKNARNHDAAWVFVKVKTTSGYQHVKLASRGHDVARDAKIVLPQDQVGAFVEPQNNHRGDVSFNVTLKLDEKSLQNAGEESIVEVFALEMVYIPQGGFTLGDPDPKSMDFAALYKSDENGQPKGLYQIDSEEQVIQIGPKDNALFYNAGRYPIYTGDQAGPVPGTFPKGVQPFYIMKYETSQGFYTEFLNRLAPDVAQSLSPHNTEKYYEGRGSIKLADGIYKTEFPDRPCNYITWDDGAAMADWAGLRPMTELEYTKAARGPKTPMAHEYPWGTDNKAGLARFVDLDDNLKIKNGLNEASISNDNRHLYGASYYWVMDLAGSLWEKCVSIGHPIGRNYRGTHGDGRTGENGEATNSDWPKGIAEEGGYGYRGGGYYQHGKNESDINPHSPIAYRTYASWSGGKRSIAYSQRYVRTAPSN
ncbi:SUMF1/EgtB/PvdO family nonheme iron enzyme [Roseivirga sp. E12]|uniref:formylglycine-generating enzyme family protein n=1 Tax=Roseivirga sp. E12 TaxID=2819237 RepID=UPI001ABD3BC1|nr:SUMF1/EgtB/PvdO family nonheme iron enzyme [Roseivirga sp. E12]MBO3696992.1 SUMF1/EgtB/PvdO family nonheme iron enzyme [Roseivirga sp. E12]